MYIRVKVKAGARAEVIKQIAEEQFNIEVREKAKNNQANKRIIKIVAEQFRIPINKVRIISGHHRPNKILGI